WPGAHSRRRLSARHPQAPEHQSRAGSPLPFLYLAALILKLALLKPITKVLLRLTLWSQIYPISMDLFSAPQSTIWSATRLHFRELDRECNKEGCLSLSETRRRCLLLTSAKRS